MPVRRTIYNTSPAIAGLLFLAASLVLAAGDCAAGTLDIRIHPARGALTPCCGAKVTDPQGRTLSGNPDTGGPVPYEIPGSYTALEGTDDDETGSPGPQSLVLYIGDAGPGEYRLDVTGDTGGEYSLELHAARTDGRTSHALEKYVAIDPGETHVYRVNLKEVPGETLTVTRMDNAEGY